MPESLDEAWTWEQFVEVLQKLKAALLRKVKDPIEIDLLTAVPA